MLDEILRSKGIWSGGTREIGSMLFAIIRIVCQFGAVGHCPIIEDELITDHRTSSSFRQGLATDYPPPSDGINHTNTVPLRFHVFDVTTNPVPC